VAVAAGALAPGPGAAQELPPDTLQEARPDSVAEEPPVETGGWGAVEVTWRPGTTVVSVTVAFPRGSSGDPEGAPGATWLLGQVVQELLDGAIGPAPRAATELAVEVDRSRTVLRLVTLPRHFEEVFRALEWAIFRAEPGGPALESARTAMEEVFTFEENAPHREFELEFYGLLAGVGSPWSRTRRGTAESVAELSSAGLADLRSRTFRRSEGVVSVVGAVSPEAAARAVTGGPPLPAGGGAADGFVPLSRRDAGTEAWVTPDRLRRTTEVTSTWIGMAWPVDVETSRTALEMLVHRLDRRFNPSPPDPGAFHVDVRLELLDSRDLLVVEAAVLPEAAGQWESRIRSAVEDIAAEEMAAPFFRAYRRRFRGSRLVEDAPPEVESLRRAGDLLRDGRTRDLPADISLLGAADLRDAASRLGEPRILLFGPDLTDGASW
jgi:hypothetical protein